MVMLLNHKSVRKKASLLLVRNWYIDGRILLCFVLLAFPLFPMIHRLHIMKLYFLTCQLGLPAF